MIVYGCQLIFIMLRPFGLYYDGLKGESDGQTQVYENDNGIKIYCQQNQLPRIIKCNAIYQWNLSDKCLRHAGTYLYEVDDPELAAEDSELQACADCWLFPIPLPTNDFNHKLVSDDISCKRCKSQNEFGTIVPENYCWSCYLYKLYSGKTGTRLLKIRRQLRNKSNRIKSKILKLRRRMRKLSLKNSK